MRDLFEKIMSEVCREYNKSWYEVFDSDLFYIVKGRILDFIFDEDYNAMINNKNFQEWTDEMYEDL